VDKDGTETEVGTKEGEKKAEGAATPE